MNFSVGYREREIKCNSRFLQQSIR